MENSIIDEFFRAPPPDVNVDAIRREWLAIRPYYRVDDRALPIPVWARREFTENGKQAWEMLRQDLGRIDPTRPFCIYIHIPFCANRCRFCDCYSFKLGNHRDQHVGEYVDLLRQEMQLWSQQRNLSRRPVSTVHLGGGTPTFIAGEPFAHLSLACRELFHTGPMTEWALESTTSELSNEMFHQMDSLGFTRLHVGVQSLEEQVRQVINRREPPTDVLEKIAKAVDRGWIVSVDLIFGLPGQSLAGLFNDIKNLSDAGVDGFSLYELQVSSRNRKFAQEYGLEERSHLANYFLFQAASQLLHLLGFQKTLFNHYARERDTNLYFTFPSRGEDCLALGTIADGVFGDYHYRHPEYAAYRRSVDEAFPGLEGGLRRTQTENNLFPIETAILSGSLLPELLLDNQHIGSLTRSEQAFSGSGESLLERWLESRLLKKDMDDEQLHLTTNGSWFAGNMMQEIT